jgi:hypothetical protein
LWKNFSQVLNVNGVNDVWQMEKIIFLWKIFKLWPNGNWLTVLQLEKYVFCITIAYLRRLAFKVGEMNQFSRAPHPDRHRGNEMVLWGHETTLTTESEAATWYAMCGAAGCRTDSARGLFDWLETAVERKVSGIIICVYNVDESTVKTF